MRDILRLLFTGADNGLLDLFGPDGAGGGDGGAADRLRQSNEWCGSTPGQGTPAAAVRGAAGPRAGRLGPRGRGSRAC